MEHNRRLNRRDFLRISGGGLVAATCGRTVAQDKAPNRPNILWITSEDNGPHLGAYDDDYADTPTLDELARQGVVFAHASSNAPVCAPARSTLITGMYPPALGSQHMRCRAVLPKDIRFFPYYLRRAGYYCTNNSKQDYNFETPADTWDESSRKAHWRKRAAGQPFFSVFNIGVTHESRIWPKGDGKTTHDPDAAPIPPYHPDVPEIRRDWAQYYDNLTKLDRRVAAMLKQLEEDGLADDTIVFYYGDHGPGLPRGKRWLYQSGLHVPLIIRFPRKYQHLAPAAPGGKTDRLVSFVDFAPSVLSLASIPIPAHMQGQAFLGSQARPPRRYTFGYRDRMDERHDFSRSVFDGRYKYIRNYMPHRPQAQYLEYMYKMPTMQAWQRLYDSGALQSPQTAFFEPKPAEELYDTQADPHEVHNLAESDQHAEILARLRRAHVVWVREVCDTGFLPEAELRVRAAGSNEFDLAQDQQRYPLERIMSAADRAGRASERPLSELLNLLDDQDSAVRYWGAVGCVMLGGAAEPAREKLLQLLNDSSPSVRITAAEALCGIGETERALLVLAEALSHERVEARLAAAAVLDELDDAARPVLPAMQRAMTDTQTIKGDKASYTGRILRKALADLGVPLEKVGEE